jgi:acyl-CoA synthetase (AMP-forming)/AMP-acid ligase II
VEQPLVIADFLNRAEIVYGARVGLIDEPDQPGHPFGPELTYAELADVARGQAAFLDGLGIEVGARVAIVSHNASRLLASYYGVCGSGRVLVPVNFRLTAEEVAFIVAHSGAELVLLDAELAHLAGEVGDVRTLILGEDDDVVFPRGRTPRPWIADERATATINYTSGTTASPKGVQLTHRNLWLNATVFGLHLGLSDRDVLLHTLPIFHVNGWGMPFMVTALGGTQVMLRKVDGGEILRRIEAHGVTLLCGAPAVLNSVLDAAASWDGPIPGSGTVRVVVAGAPPPTTTIERIERDLGWEFCQIYGLTETSPVLTVNRTRAEWDWLSSHERARRLGRAGVPVLGTALRMSDDHEVLARSNAVMASYWQNPGATEEALRDGWFHTGDGGVVDDKGYLSITDRKKDVIITGGENVSSIEVEDVLLRHPHIREAAVIGIPDERWGELVTALIVTDGTDLDLDEVAAMAREHLAGYKIPRRFELRAELARTATGKLQKAALRAPFWEGRDRAVN